MGYRLLLKYISLGCCYLNNHSSWVLFVFLVFGHTSLHSQDINPPIIIKEARDTVFSCTQVAINQKLTEWYNAHANAIAEDESGQVVFVASPSLAEAIEILSMPADTTLCRIKSMVRVTFVAVDEAGNSSIPTSALFYQIDNQGPTINTVPNVLYNCETYIADTLNAWIRNKAGYIANDACSSPIRWTNFQYAISVNNSVIQSGGGSITNGPYPEIPNGVCNWRMNINFFVQDSCGNQTITPGTTTFTVNDNIAPEILTTWTDTIVQCHEIPDTIIIVIDGCDQSPTIDLVETSTQNIDTNQCSHYNYVINRTYTVTDKCNNVSTLSQRIEVRDTLAPTFTQNPIVSLPCDAFIDSIFLLDIKDQCSPSYVEYNDSIQSEGCNREIKRTYTVQDVCDNQVTYPQIIKLHNNQNPILTNSAKDQTFRCDTLADINALLSQYILNRGGSSAMGICSPLQSFAAIKGSYDINDPSTYPGILPTELPQQTCPSLQNQLLRGVAIDFVYYDTCGNATITTGLFGLLDSLAPIVSNCVNGYTYYTDLDDCGTTVRVPKPTAIDDCVASSDSIIVTQKVRITSPSPGVDSVVDTAYLTIGPINTFSSTIQGGAILMVTLRNLDIDDNTEFFYIVGENNTSLGTTPIGGPQQCSSVTFSLTITETQLLDWLNDGYIDLSFIPNQPVGVPVAAINDICSNSEISVTLSFAIDSQNTIHKAYSIKNNMPIQYDDNSDLPLYLSTGEHLVTFIFTDCANNQSTCETTITILDTIAPSIICPTSIKDTLDFGKCMDSVKVPLQVLITENCSLSKVYDKIVPTSKEAALLSFTYIESLNLHVARNRQFVFTDLFPIHYWQSDINIDVEWFGDNNQIGETFQIFGPGGYLIGVTGISSTTMDKCGIVQDHFTVDRDIFNLWLNNGQINLLAVPNNSANVDGNGINPCMTLLPNQTTDSESYMQIRISYTDARIAYAVSGNTTLPKTTLSDQSVDLNLLLNSGENSITLFTQDASGNEGSCTFDIEVMDIEAPKAMCKNNVINLHPSGLTPYFFSDIDLDAGSLDNCGIDTSYYIPQFVDCSMIGGDVVVKHFVKDVRGNIDSCSSIVRVKTIDLMPSYSSGLCSNDTLKLFANVPPSSVPGSYSFHWQGPNGFTFFTENPIIPNVSETYNGTYTLTVTGFNGCTSVGSVLVNIKPLINPTITLANDTICENIDLLLTTTNYTGNISYEWYEGIYPNGVLIQVSSIPQIIINPIVGVHFYYIIARGPDCASNPSPLTKVTILKTPIATVSNSFISLCEGETITLHTPNSNPNYSYQWQGPAGYIGEGVSPTPIVNASLLNEGIYTLVIRNNICLSDTASVNVILLEKPNTPTITGADIFCQGSIFNLLAVGSDNGDSYEWYRNDMLFTITNENSLIIPNAQDALQGNWKVRSKKDGCYSLFSVSKTIAVDNLLEIGATNSGPICAGDTLQLLATFVPNATYKWEGPVNNIPSVSNPKILGVAGDYYVTITTPTMCENNASTTVKVIDVPVITALSNNASLCYSSSDTIRFFPSVFPNNMNYQYQWTGPNNFTSSSSSPYLTNATLLDTGLYVLQILNQGCPSLPANTRVNFFITPPIPIITGPTTTCQGDTIILSIDYALSSGSLHWNTPVGNVVTMTNALVIPSVNGNNGGIYSVSIEENNCISEVSFPISIEVFNYPTLPTIDLPNKICYGDSLLLVSNAPSGVDFMWSGPNGFISNAPSPIIKNVTSDNEGIYSLKIGQHGCFLEESPSAFVSVAKSIPTPSFTLDIIQSCSVENLNVEICVTPTSLIPNGIISLLESQSNTIIASGTTDCYLVNPQSLELTGTNFITAQLELDGCFSELSSHVVLSVNEPPTIQATAQETLIESCPDQIVSVSSIYQAPLVDIDWIALNPDLHILNPKEATTVINNLDFGNNTVILQYSVPGCPNFSADTISIYKHFAPTLVDDEYLLALENKQFDLPITVNDIVSKDFTITIVDQVQNGRAIVDGDKIVYTPDIRYLTDEKLIYRVCSDECPDLCSQGQVLIRFEEDIPCNPPSIITPNGDNVNDIFVVTCLESDRYKNNKLSVVNEWGNEVYFANPYNNDWDGTYGGNPLPVGTYFYILHVEGIGRPIHGFLIIQR